MKSNTKKSTAKKPVVKSTKKPATKKPVVKKLPAKKTAAKKSVVVKVPIQNQVAKTQPEKPGYPIVMTPCKRGSDIAHSGQKCSGRRAYNMSQPGASVVVFKCVQCSYSWSVTIGGACNLF
jgi:hypothetical protein